VNTTLLLRIASVIALLFAVGHTSGHPWTPSGDLAPAAVVRAMKGVGFDAMGSSRTYWDFYVGFGLSINVYMFAQAAVLWLLATLAKTQPPSVRPFVVVLLVACAANGYVAWRHLFLLPVVLSVAMAVCLALALVASKSRVGT
jgi:hypothetical protein